MNLTYGRHLSPALFYGPHALGVHRELAGCRFPSYTVVPAWCHTTAWLKALRWAEQGLRRSLFLPESRSLYSENPGRGQRVTWNQPMKSKGPTREHMSLLSLREVWANKVWTQNVTNTKMRVVVMIFFFSPLNLFCIYFISVIILPPTRQLLLQLPFLVGFVIITASRNYLDLSPSWFLRDPILMVIPSFSLSSHLNLLVPSAEGE